LFCFFGIQTSNSIEINWDAPSFKEKFEEKLDDDTKLFQFLKIIWMKLPILNETQPNMWMKR